MARTNIRLLLEITLNDKTTECHRIFIENRDSLNTAVIAIVPLLAHVKRNYSLQLWCAFTVTACESAEVFHLIYTDTEQDRLNKVSLLDPYFKNCGYSSSGPIVV